MTDKHNLLKKLVYSGARDKNLIISDMVLDRISYELAVIKKLSFTDYFILFSRIIEICNGLNLLRSYGRNSAANSIVNYCLDITKINPIDENLIFERFINPKQKHLPDIDIDIPMGYQKSIIELLKQKYPEYYSYYIAFSPQINSDYIDVFYKNTAYKKHPCGIIITTKKLINSTFLHEEQEFYIATDGLNDPIFENKFDILELDYLNKLQLIANEIGDKYHPYKLPLNDKQVFNYFTTENLDDVFQFSAPSLKHIFAQFKPSSIQDLSIINSMLRPDPIDYIQTILDFKLNYNERFHWSDVRVSEILKETYGFLIYQETFLNLSREIAGLGFSEAEGWRRKIMKDKTKTESIAFKSLFVNGCRENSSLKEDEITSLTNLVTDSLPMAFQKAHSLPYSIIGYWGCYYKLYFRKQFDHAFKSNNKFQLF